MSIIVSLGSFAMIFGIVYIIVTARNRERMALIEKGADPRLFESVKRSKTYQFVKWGLFLFGIGLGIVFGDLLSQSGAMSHGAAYFSMIFIFGGLALVASHFLLKKKELQEQEKN